MFSVERDILYKSDSATPSLHSLDLYLPENSVTVPSLLVYIHGGLWMDRDKRDYENIGKLYTKNGYALAVINYRLSKSADAKPVVHPLHTQDAADALIFLYSNGEKYNYNKNSIFLIGHSCGSHMIGLILLNRKRYLPGADKLKVKGAISLQGLFDQDLFLKDFPDFTSQIELVFTKDRNNWEAPQGAKNGDANFNTTPWLLIHSPGDSWVHNTQTTNFVKHLNTIGCTDVTTVLDNITGGHFEVIVQIGTNDDQLSTHILPFISKHL
jgi:alpha-beta hydrolase superfamily lysophospholipase